MANKITKMFKRQKFVASNRTYTKPEAVKIRDDFREKQQRQTRIVKAKDGRFHVFVGPIRKKTGSRPRRKRK